MDVEEDSSVNDILAACVTPRIANLDAVYGEEMLEPVLMARMSYPLTA
jgi:hypothetical protein